MARYDDLNVTRIAIVGVISIVVTAVTVLAVQVLFYAMAKRSDELKAQQSDYRRQNQFIADQQSEISQYGVDPQTGNVTIPIDRAIELVVAQDESRQSDEQSTQQNDI